MKTRVFFFFCFLLFYHTLKAQNDNALELGFGLTKFGAYGSFGVDFQLTEKSYFKSVFIFENASNDKVQARSSMLDLGYYYSFLKLSKLYISGSVSAFNSLSSVSVLKNEKVTQELKKYNLGLAPGAEVGIILSEKITLLANFKQVFFINDMPRSKMFLAGTGLKFNLN